MNATQSVLSQAMRENLGKPTRSEKLDSWVQVLVQPFALSALINNSNQIIFGRRGSGKTMYLKSLEETLATNLPRYKTLAVFSTVNDFLVSPDELPENYNSQQKAKHCFASFITGLSESLVEQFDHISKNRDLATALKIDRNALSSLQDTLLRLRYILAHGDPRSLPFGILNVESAYSESRREVRSAGSGFKLSGGAKGNAAGLEASGSVRNERSRSKIEVSQLEAQRSLVVPTHAIRQLAEQLVDQFRAETLMIMIDEWPLLGDAQVDFAEYIRRCFFNHPRLCVKLAADRYTFRLAERQTGGATRGVELGADIFEAADLDLPLHGTDESLPLYGEMLVKRLAHFEPEMYNHFGQVITDEPMYIIDELFHNRRAFTELCNGAQGLSRDFLELFAQCSNEIHCDARMKITYEHVHKVLLRDSQTVMTVVRSSVSAAHVLNTRVMDLVCRTQTPFFFTRKDATGDCDVLRELVTKRVVHLVPNGHVDPAVDAEYDCFEVDYSVYSEWRDLIEWSTELQPLGDMRRSLRRINLEAARSQFLDFPSDKISTGSEISCNLCGRKFSSMALPYVKKGLCAYCFEPVGGDRNP